MTPPVFVLRTDDLADATIGCIVRVSGEEGRHAATVRRVEPGEIINLVDGHGRRVTGTVSTVIDRQTIDVDVVAVRDEPVPALRVVVVQALTKGDRGELAVEQLTQIGVDEILPWSAAHSVVQWRGDRAAKSARRWADAATAAAKQSRRARFPLMGRLASTDDVRDRIGAASTAIVLDESASASIGEIDVPAAGELLIVVGPEGGISGDERAAFAAAGAQIVRMGPTVLRASSAGLAAVAVLLSSTPRWSSDAVEG